MPVRNRRARPSRSLPVRPCRFRERGPRWSRAAPVWLSPPPPSAHVRARNPNPNASPPPTATGQFPTLEHQPRRPLGRQTPRTPPGQPLTRPQLSMDESCSDALPCPRPGGDTSSAEPFYGAAAMAIPNGFIPTPNVATAERVLAEITV